MKAKLKIFFLSIVFLFGIIFTTNNVKAATTRTTLRQSENTIFVNDQYTIPLSDKLKNATYIYTSNKTKVAKVNSKGIITGLDNGTASIKVRYKYDGEIYTVGTFTVNVNKTSLNDTYKSFDMLTGDTLEPKKYLENPNPNAVYVISSTSTKVASGGSDGIIHAKKAGRAAISIYEVHNEKTRPVGAIGVSVTGASFKKDSIKMAYNMSINNNDLLDDMETGATYKWTSSNSGLVSTSNTRITSTRSGSSTQTCDITVQETTANKKTHTIGKMKVTVTNDTFVSSLDQELTIGFGEVLTVGNGIVIYNRPSGAQYKLSPADVTVLKPEDVKNSSTKLEGIGYGNTDVTIEEIRNGKTTKTLEDKVNVTVSQAQILDELLSDGLRISVNGSTYNAYPFKYRNVKATYDYTSANSKICSVGSGGMNKDEDFLVAVGKKVGETKISVYETVTNIKTNSGATSAPTISSSRKKIGTFNVIVDDGSSPSPSGSANPSGSPSASGSPNASGNPNASNSPAASEEPAPSDSPDNPDNPDPTDDPNHTKAPIPSSDPSIPKQPMTQEDIDAYFDDPVAKRLINTIKFTYNDKTYEGDVSDYSLECVFGYDDDDGNPIGYIDYGTNFDNINITKEDIDLQWSNIEIVGIEPYGTEFTISIKLPDEDETIEDVTIVLNEGEFDTRSILKEITVTLGTSKNKPTYIIGDEDDGKNKHNHDLYDEDTRWFDDGNKDFKAYFKPDEYCKVGAHEFDDYMKESYLLNLPEKHYELDDKYDDDGNIIGKEKYLSIPDGTLSDINNSVFCVVELNTDPETANSAINLEQTDTKFNVVSDDGQYFTFEVEFENETTEEFSVELDVDLEHLTDGNKYDI